MIKDNNTQRSLYERIMNDVREVFTARVYEDFLDQVEAREQGSAASRLAKDSYLAQVEEAVENILAGRPPGIMLQNDVSVWPVTTNHDALVLISACIKMFGPKCNLNWIDVSGLEDFSHLFSNSFNGDISKWDTSSAKSMNYMFAGNKSFNGNISKWNVSGVRDFAGMFCDTVFNRDIFRWDVSSAETMGCMFLRSKFNQDIYSWDVSNCKDFQFMFSESTFSRDISQWPVPPREAQTDGMFNNNPIKRTRRPVWAR